MPKKNTWDVIEEAPIVSPSTPPAIAGLDILDKFVNEADERPRALFALGIFRMYRSDFTLDEVIATIDIERKLSRGDCNWSDYCWIVGPASDSDWQRHKQWTQAELDETFGTPTPDITLALIDSLDQKLAPPYVEFVMKTEYTIGYPRLELTEAGRRKSFLRLLRQRLEAGRDAFGVLAGHDPFGKILPATAA